MNGHVTTTVRYLAPSWRDVDKVPIIAGWADLAAHTVAHTVDVHDAHATDCDVETTGFQRVPHRTAVTDFRDPAAVTRTYFPEVAALVGELTGADHAIVTHHFIRWGHPADFDAGYAGFLHGDKPLTDPVGYSWDRVDELDLRLDPADDWEFAWYNTWQPVDHPATRNPLALIDARTVAAADYHPYSYDGGATPNLETVPLHNPAHRFHYFPDLTPDELIVFKQLETRPARTPTCLHSAIDTPAPPDTPLRRSIEVRWMCAFRR
ncbi:CmcJ/NvfI family oxidoreductase [Actinokineospora inagensis]|uniref:CmcJ/NvfI family oxidoreductase n=1 Tax=Actinokineospora inagensis TaxID=103730 RepID=UPI0012FC3D28|nr:CmcJ/NvfI family oxidoreductase [Actinokineospora inagensis]